MQFTFPSELPITAHIDEIADALRQHQVLIVCGDTGSGKTTQLPKIALKIGRGKRGLIGCTQPRRLAAIAMARRVSEELGVRSEELGVNNTSETKQLLTPHSSLLTEKTPNSSLLTPNSFVGYQHRFESRLSKDTVIKFMTDGILLAEIGRAHV
jgi:ATP-dependent helicase HrpA